MCWRQAWAGFPSLRFVPRCPLGSRLVSCQPVFSCTPSFTTCVKRVKRLRTQPSSRSVCNCVSLLVISVCAICSLSLDLSLSLSLDLSLDRSLHLSTQANQEGISRTRRLTFLSLGAGLVLLTWLACRAFMSIKLPLVVAFP